MSIHQCPKCELRFALAPVLEDHIRNDHPGFHHDYPVAGIHHVDAEADAQAAVSLPYLPPR